MSSSAANAERQIAITKGAESVRARRVDGDISALESGCTVRSPNALAATGAATAYLGGSVFLNQVWHVSGKLLEPIFNHFWRCLGAKVCDVPHRFCRDSFIAAHGDFYQAFLRFHFLLFAKLIVVTHIFALRIRSAFTDINFNFIEYRGNKTTIIQYIFNSIIALRARNAVVFLCITVSDLLDGKHFNLLCVFRFALLHSLICIIHTKQNKASFLTNISEGAEQAL